MRSSKSIAYYQNYFSKHIDKAIPFDSITYDNECRFNWKDSLFTGYLLKENIDRSKSLIIVTNGFQTGGINLDTLGKITTISFDSTDILDAEIHFYQNGNWFYKIAYQKSEYDKSWCIRHQHSDIFGPSIKNAEIIEYYENGQIFAQKFYGPNGMDGTWKFYHPNGKLFTYYVFENNKQVGKWKQYNEKGKKIGYIKFKNDKIVKSKGYQFDEKSDCFKFMKNKSGKIKISSKCSKYNFDNKLRYCI